MKKIFFLFTMVLVVSMAMAQNTANLSQTGDNQEANINQAGINNAKVTQFTDNGGHQKSTVLQTGNRNDVIVKQDQTGGGGNSPGNTAFIEQIGDDNYGNQFENAPGYNSGQKVEAYQIGNSNSVRQSILSGYTELLFAKQEGSENTAVQEAAGGGNNNGYMYQDGNQNWAKQKMFGNNNGYNYLSKSVIINQLGDLNKAKQLLTGNGQGHINKASISQDGDGNDALQVGEGRNLNFQLSQLGNDNKSIQKAWGIDNTSWLNQEGESNTSRIIQDGDDNSIKLNQMGSDGIINVLQEGNTNIIAGIDDAGAVLEWGDVYNLKAKQLGENNKLYVNSIGTVKVMQDNTTGGSMIGNEIRYFQSGLSTSSLSQVGDENFIGLNHGGTGVANIKQEGNSNRVGSFTNVFAFDPVLDEVGCGTFNGEKLNVNQMGEGNLLHLNSTGYSDVVRVLQTGNNNRASVTQSGL